MNLFSSVASITFIVSVLWWQGYSATWVVFGTIAMLAVFGAMYSVGPFIERLTGRTPARNSRSDAVYFVVVIAGYLTCVRFRSDSDFLSSVLALGIVMTLGRLLGQLAFGTRGTDFPSAGDARKLNG